VIYEFGSVKVDAYRHTLERNGESVPVPPRAMDALLLLIARRGETVSKEELLKRLWPDAHVEESNLPVLLSAVRRAVGDDGRHQRYIQTVSRSGYRFVGEVRELSAGRAAAGAETRMPHVEVKARNGGRFFAAGVARVAVVCAVVLAILVARRSGGAGGAVTAASQGIWSEARGGTGRADAEMWRGKGHYAWNLQTTAGLLRSIEYYQKAIEADAEYAPAYAGLAEAYVTLPSYSAHPDDGQFSQARAAAARALELDEQLADAHIAAGMVAMIVDQNFGRAEAEFRRAVALNPKIPLAEGELALCLVATGRTDEAVMHARKAKAADPLSIRAATDVGIALYYARRFGEAEAELDEALKLDPYSYRAYENLGKVLLAQGKYGKAREELERATTLSPDPLGEGLEAAALALGGNAAGARQMLTRLEQRAQTSYVTPVSLALALEGLGRREEALRYLKQAQSDRAIAALFLRVEPRWDAMRGTAGFQELVKEMGSGRP